MTKQVVWAHGFFFTAAFIHCFSLCFLSSAENLTQLLKESVLFPLNSSAIGTAHHVTVAMLVGPKQLLTLIL